MPWKECNKMDERLKFIARLLDGEKMAVLCRQFNISRKTGHNTSRPKAIGMIAKPAPAKPRQQRQTARARLPMFWVMTKPARMKPNGPLKEKPKTSNPVKPHCRPR